MHPTIHLLSFLDFVNPNTFRKIFFRRKLSSSEHFNFGLVLKDAKSLCLLKFPHHLSRKALRKMYRMYLVLWAIMRGFVRNKRNHRVSFHHVLKDHRNEIAEMGVADLKQHEKTENSSVLGS